jgi:hypothetical protein
MMQTQWYLCEIENYPEDEGNKLKKTNNLAVTYPDIFVGGITSLLIGDSRAVEANKNKEGKGAWYVWLPIIPRVGDTLQFAGWPVQVSKVVLITNWLSETGIQEGLFVSALISIH